MAKAKVYCSNCAWFNGDIFHPECAHQSNISKVVPRDDWFIATSEELYTRSPKIINAKNNCSDFFWGRTDE